MAGKAILKLDRIVNFSAANRQLFSSGNSASRLPRGYNARVIELTMIALVASATLSVVAIFCFAWSMPAARVLLPFAVIAAGFGVFGASRIAATPQSGFAAWAFLFACACCGSGLNAIRNLFFRPVRWIHRFTIYSGYGATFAAMGAAALYLQVRAASNRMAAIALVAVYLVGSACIFLAKTFTARRAIKTMPGYQASPKTDDDGRGYW